MPLVAYIRLPFPRVPIVLPQSFEWFLSDEIYELIGPYLVNRVRALRLSLLQ
jgi:hypothetical protein